MLQNLGYDVGELDGKLGVHDRALGAFACSNHVARRTLGYLSTSRELLIALFSAKRTFEKAAGDDFGIPTIMRDFPAFVCVALLVVAPLARSADVGFQEVSGIFARQCVMCHQPYDAKGELTLHPAAAWQNVVEVGSGQVDMFLVAPGDLELSYLYRKLTNTHLEVGGTGDQMPFDAQLSAEELATIRMWIEQGAKNEQ